MSLHKKESIREVNIENPSRSFTATPMITGGVTSMNYTIKNYKTRFERLCNEEVLGFNDGDESCEIKNNKR